MLSSQAFVLAICNVCVLIAVLLSMFVIKKNTDNGETSSAMVKNVVALVFFIFIMVMQVYSLNCMVRGDCHVWAWILAAFGVIGTLSYLGAFVYILMSSKKNDKTVADASTDSKAS